MGWGDIQYILMENGEDRVEELPLYKCTWPLDFNSCPVTPTSIF